MFCRNQSVSVLAFAARQVRGVLDRRAAVEFLAQWMIGCHYLKGHKGHERCKGEAARGREGEMLRTVSWRVEKRERNSSSIDIEQDAACSRSCVTQVLV